MPPEIPTPWDAFLADLDDKLAEPVDLVCIGGFVISLMYGLSRPTSDVDVLEVRPSSLVPELSRLAGLNSPLHEKHRVYLDHRASVAHYPDGYEDRLSEMFPHSFRHLRLLALDPYDLALSKLERNADRDREDVYYLAESVPLDLDVLEKRYQDEMRPYFADQLQDRHDTTLRLWLDVIHERGG